MRDLSKASELWSSISAYAARFMFLICLSSQCPFHNFRQVYFYFTDQCRQSILHHILSIFSHDISVFTKDLVDLFNYCISL